MAQNGAASLSVPLSALTDNDGRPAVWVIDAKEGQIHKREVSTSSNTVRSALRSATACSQNEWIVQAGVHLLREGEPVRAVDADNRPVRLGAKAAAKP